MGQCAKNWWPSNIKTLQFDRKISKKSY